MVSLTFTVVLPTSAKHVQTYPQRYKQDCHLSECQSLQNNNQDYLSVYAHTRTFTTYQYLTQLISQSHGDNFKWSTRVLAEER